MNNRSYNPSKDKKFQRFADELEKNQIGESLSYATLT